VGKCPLAQISPLLAASLLQHLGRKRKGSFTPTTTTTLFLLQRALHFTQVGDGGVKKKRSRLE